MNITIRFAITSVALGLALAQNRETLAAFEVASIKPAPTQMMSRGKIRIGMSIDAGHVSGTLSLMDMIAAAYDVKPYQVVGPDWLTSERFDVNAKIPDGVPETRVNEMFQTLLADRFKLTIHRDTKDHAIYALVVGKNGPKLQEAAPDESDPAGPSRNVSRMKTQGGRLHMQIDRTTMKDFADTISRFLDRPVIDMTGLTGSYQMSLDLSMDDMKNMMRSQGINLGVPGAPSDSAADPSGSSVFTAVQQFGLKLESRKAPLEAIVVDRLEKSPTEN
jgi:uncharacterized protein (TIGR03435 family)